MDQFVGEIRIFPFNFAPTGWALCDGQLLPIAQNLALFSLLGTFYGGNGENTFALPDLQSSVPLHADGPIYDLGQAGGEEWVTLAPDEIPPHTHRVHAEAGDLGDVTIPGSTAVFAVSDGAGLYQNSADTQLSPQAIAPTGGGLPHNNMMPYLTFTFCIALQGIFPPRP
jgi:microcystin-dependent protein